MPFSGIPPAADPGRSAATAAFLYAAVGLTWIAFSDWFLRAAAPTPELYAILQTWKGGLFVAVTSVLLFLMLRTQFRRRAAENARLRVAHERLSSHVRNSPLAMVEFDSEFRVRRWSPRAAQLFGWSRDEVVGLRWSDWKFVFEDDLGEVERIVADSLARGDRGSYSLNRNYRNDGTILYCEWYNSWIHDQDGGIVSMMSLVHDVTAEREAADEVLVLNRELEARVHRRTDELAQANADLKTLSYSISHDLRAPVRAVIGFGEILERRYLESMPEEGRAYLANILAAGEQMDTLIDGLLVYGSLEVANLAPEIIDSTALVARVAEELDAGLAAPIGDIEIEDSLPEVYADPQYLRRIFHNLLSNARKYGGNGAGTGLRVRVSGEPGLDGGGPSLRVADNGPGIAVEHRERVFEPFERLHQQEQVKGAGLGLAVVKRSMELMGGSVSIETGGIGMAGTTFRLGFPPLPAPARSIR